MTTIGLTTRDVARELARRYSTMTHDELDVLESILVPMKFQKGEVILKEGHGADMQVIAVFMIAAGQDTADDDFLAFGAQVIDALDSGAVHDHL